MEVENPTEKFDFLENSPFYRDSVGTEELNKNTKENQSGWALLQSNLGR